MTENKTASLQTAVEPNVKNRVDQIASQRGMTTSTLLRTILLEWLAARIAAQYPQPVRVETDAPGDRL